MADRIFPNWNQLKQQHQPLTEGELTLLKYLDNYLPKDRNWQIEQPLTDYHGWLIFSQPYLNGNRPDIIVFNPYVGGMVIEVKDWRLAHYRWSKKLRGKYEKDILKVSDSNGSYEVKSPLTQVIHYKEIIIGQLVPLIGERADKNKAAYGLFKVGVYFHNEITENVKDFFSKKVKDYGKFPVFGFDLLRSADKLDSIVPDVKWSSNKYWDRAWNSELLFWFKPPYHSIEQGTLLKLRADQLRIAEPANGHFRVKGVAGSGKTQALAYRAAKLASQNKNVLIITFNITLWHYIKDMIARVPFNFSWSYIIFNHFHGFCRDLLNELGEEWPESPQEIDYRDKEKYQADLEDFFRSSIPESIISCIHNKRVKKFDAILIDEGQDFYVEWYSLLSKYFLTNNDEALVVVDKKQNIYQRELDWFDRRNRNMTLDKFKSEIITLTTTFRLPKRIAIMANEFSESFDLDHELKVARFVQYPQLLFIDHIVWINIDENKKFEWIYKAFETLKKEGESASDMVILLPNHKIGQECVNYFESKSIKVNHIFENASESRFHIHKKAFWMGDSRLKMSTIHSFKGWELMNIIIFLPSKTPESNKKLDSILYTALTRSRKNLVIFNSNERYKEFGNRFPHRWSDQNVYH